jgi:hypothetical protein
MFLKFSCVDRAGHCQLQLKLESDPILQSPLECVELITGVEPAALDGPYAAALTPPLEPRSLYRRSTETLILCVATQFFNARHGCQGPLPDRAL